MPIRSDLLALAGLDDRNPASPELLQYLATQPVMGVNVHQEPQGMRQAYIDQQAIEPLAFGAMGDPVSQLAFLGAPGLLRASKGTLEALATPGPRLGGRFASERGNLGPPPLGPRGEPLPESVVRTPEGRLQRLYHGTNRAYPDFEMSQASSGAGGDLYGKGIYMTENPQVAYGYAGLMGRRTGTAADAERIYQPGAIVEGYGGRDKVLAFEPGEGWNWRVQVQAVDRAGNPIRGERPRWHSTPPRVEKTPNIRPVYADLKKPFDMAGGYTDADVKQLLRATGDPYAIRRAEASTPIGDTSGESVYRMLTSYVDKDAANKALQQAGYDGITHMGGVRGGQPHRVYIALSPENVYPSVNVDAPWQGGAR